jgi:DNA-binding CsgD family transcriptional regulator
VEAAPGGTLPVEQAASLLAMHCLVRRQVPRDYAVLVVPRGTLLDPVGRRAQELLEVGRAIGPEVRLTPREREVLDCVMRSLSNKEIAVRLNVSERTVKFHVSALLAKFEVSDRLSLIREAMTGLQPATTPPADTLFGHSVPVCMLTDRPEGVRPAAHAGSVLRIRRPEGARDTVNSNNSARRPIRFL